MQSTFTALPELDGCRFNFVATPIVRARNFLSIELLLKLLHAILQDFAIGDDGGLLAGASAQLASARSTMKVSFRSFTVRLHDRAFDANLTLQVHPQKAQGDIGASCYLRGLGGVVVGVEKELAAIDPFQQNHSRADRAVAVSGGQCHRVGFDPIRQVPLAGFIKPDLELNHWVGIDVFLIKSRQRVIFTHFFNRHGSFLLIIFGALSNDFSVVSRQIAMFYEHLAILMRRLARRLPLCTQENVRLPSWQEPKPVLGMMLCRIL